MSDDLSSADLLYGVGSIAAFLGMPKRTCQHRIDQGQLPTFRLGGKKGGTICARRTTLRSHLAKLEREAQAGGDDAGA